MKDRCPNCHKLLAYTVDGRDLSHCIGVEISGIYDGVLFWQCPFCNARWHRFSKKDSADLYKLARAYVENF